MSAQTRRTQLLGTLKRSANACRGVFSPKRRALCLGLAVLPLLPVLSKEERAYLTRTAADREALALIDALREGSYMRCENGYSAEGATISQIWRAKDYEGVGDVLLWASTPPVWVPADFLMVTGWPYWRAKVVAIECGVETRDLTSYRATYRKGGTL